ncbi:hypothetical protein [Burkholderia territorii]|uniref:hypothetical protein n=1 Tax=Burkholderia territorii TaxID=1503055 RepID=UPI000ADC1CB2|nr:hypothetical protein [Burkholderia territorii]
MSVRVADTTHCALDTIGHHCAVRSDPRYFDVVACRSRDFVVCFDRGCVERHRPNRKACAMRREPAPGKRLGHTPGVMREGIDGNVSGTHLFSAIRRYADGRGNCQRAQQCTADKYERIVCTT